MKDRWEMTIMEAPDPILTWDQLMESLALRVENSVGYREVREFNKWTGQWFTERKPIVQSFPAFWKWILANDPAIRMTVGVGTDVTLEQAHEKAGQIQEVVHFLSLQLSLPIDQRTTLKTFEEGMPEVYEDVVQFFTVYRRWYQIRSDIIHKEE